MNKLIVLAVFVLGACTPPVEPKMSESNITPIKEVQPEPVKMTKCGPVRVDAVCINNKWVIME